MMNSFIIGFLFGSLLTELLMLLYYEPHDEEE